MEIYCCLAHVLKTSLLSPRLKLERQRKGEQGEGSEEEKMKGYTPFCQEGVGLEGGEGKREERIKQKIVGWLQRSTILEQQWMAGSHYYAKLTWELQAATQDGGKPDNR